jgi:serine/threonine protein kinase
VTGALSNDDSIWDNVDGPIEADEAYWEGMRKKWKATLIDFGFARALTPEDVIKPSLEVRKENLDASYHANNIDLSNSGKRRSSFMRLSSSSFLSSSRHGLNDSRSRHGLNSSRTSRTMRRAMSAVGNHEFAAPEIRREMHEEDHADPVTVTDTIGHTVSEYGLLVDAYSLGCTLRFMMTGCLPRVRVKDAISEQNNLIYKLIGTCVNRKKKRQIRYRLEEDLPAEAQRLISKMTEKAEKKRTSVRAARRYPWVADVLNESSDSDDKIKYLQVVLDSVKEKGLDDQILEA